MLAKSKEYALVFSIILIFCNPLNISAESQYLPFYGGEMVYCMQGNFDDPSNTSSNPNPTHTKLNKYGEPSSMRYAWDLVPSNTS